MEILFRAYFGSSDGDYGEFKEVSKFICASTEEEFTVELNKVILSNQQSFLMYYKCSVEDI